MSSNEMSSVTIEKRIQRMVGRWAGVEGQPRRGPEAGEVADFATSREDTNGEHPEPCDAAGDYVIGKPNRCQ